MVEEEIKDTVNKINAVSSELAEGGLFTGSIGKMNKPKPKDKEGSAGTDEIDISFIDDRSKKLELTRDDEGCIWAYENDTCVSTSVDKYVNLINNGFVIKPNYSKKDFDKDRERKDNATIDLAKEINVLRLRSKLDSALKLRHIIGFGLIKIINSANNNIIGLLELDSAECEPIRDLQTGELGGKTGRKLNPNNEKQEVAIVQYGNVASYDSYGTPILEQKYFYMSRDEIIVFTNNDRGKFKGKSPVMRILRLVEIKKTLENIVQLIVLRYGPQVLVMFGNQDVNLSKVKIPEEYLRDNDNNLRKKADALTAYKTSLMNSLSSSLEDWLEGDTLAQIVEYGLDIKLFSPTSNLFDYQKYIAMFEGMIRQGIFSSDLPGRVDITSGAMLARLPRELRDKIMSDRENIETELRESLVKRLLVEKGYKEDDVILTFKDIDLEDDRIMADIERIVSDTVYNYAKAGYMKMPERIAEKYNIPAIIEQSQEEVKDNTKEDIKKKGNKPKNDLDDDSTGVNAPDHAKRKMLREVQKGR